MFEDCGPNKNRFAKNIRIDIDNLTDDELIALVQSIHETLGELFASIVTVE